mmetsp:Transcript_18076/g.48620  ORF Transcript_18076/g.48620 Transcript_18076/m.48620 type:complete len:331 (+) Transcript_18076:402-1394(+)
MRVRRGRGSASGLARLGQAAASRATAHLGRHLVVVLLLVLLLGRRRLLLACSSFGSCQGSRGFFAVVLLLGRSSLLLHELLDVRDGHGRGGRRCGLCGGGGRGLGLRRRFAARSGLGLLLLALSLERGRGHGPALGRLALSLVLGLVCLDLREQCIDLVLSLQVPLVLLLLLLPPALCLRGGRQGSRGGRGVCGRGAGAIALVLVLLVLLVLLILAACDVIIISHLRPRFLCGARLRVTRFPAPLGRGRRAAAGERGRLSQEDVVLLVRLIAPGLARGNGAPKLFQVYRNSRFGLGCGCRLLLLLFLLLAQLGLDGRGIFRGDTREGRET